jgi:O-antigen/teichoic acid export membrane protein
MKNLKKKGYRSAFKATSLFGGIQVFIILIKVIKSKLVAVWLGPTGFGIMSLFNAAISLISSISNLGLQNSAVRDIASAQGQNNPTLVSKIIKSINQWVWATGLFGAIITIILSPWLSKLLFESDKYTISFILLSSVVLLTAIFNGHYAVLQGTR